jgi:hypothetical protein
MNVIVILTIISIIIHIIYIINNHDIISHIISLIIKLYYIYHSSTNSNIHPISYINLHDYILSTSISYLFYLPLGVSNNAFGNLLYVYYKSKLHYSFSLFTFLSITFSILYSH